MNASRFIKLPSVDKPLGIAIGRTEYGNTHVGIVVTGSSNRSQLLHLAWHCKLMSEPIEAERYALTVPALEPERALFFSVLAESIISRKPLIPYALQHYPGTTFSIIDGNVVLAKDGKGLNCVTFVLAFFSTYGFNLIDYSSWVVRAEEDVAWQRTLVDWLRKTTECDGAKQADLVESEIGCARIRPEELAGACLEDTLPANFEQCKHNAEWILDQIQPQAPYLLK